MVQSCPLDKTPNPAACELEFKGRTHWKFFLDLGLQLPLLLLDLIEQILHLRGKMVFEFQASTPFPDGGKPLWFEQIKVGRWKWHDHVSE